MSAFGSRGMPRRKIPPGFLTPVQPVPGTSAGSRHQVQPDGARRAAADASSFIGTSVNTVTNQTSDRGTDELGRSSAEILTDRRQDAPVVQSYSRASRQRALEVSGSSTAVEDALKDLHDSMHANSAKKPRLSLESTVRVLHARAFPSEELLP
eukprot:272959-Amphidinium_carterae.1